MNIDNTASENNAASAVLPSAPASATPTPTPDVGAPAPSAPTPTPDVPERTPASSTHAPTYAPTLKPAHPQYAYAGYAYKPYEMPENLFKPRAVDFIFALTAFALGYLFAQFVLFTWKGWGVTVFSASYIFISTAYLIKKDAFAMSGASLFWMAATLLTGASYALWENAGLAVVRSFFLFFSAVYYIITASGNAVMRKTSNYLILDAINAVIILPFRNFANQYVSFAVLKREEKSLKKAIPVLIGILTAILLAAVIIPLLVRADSGGFRVITNFFLDYFTVHPEIITEAVIYGIFAIPVAAYMYGLISGAAYKKGTEILKPCSDKDALSNLRFIQSATVFIALGAVCILYIVFILSQIPYIFSAFTGSRPAGWLIYSEYARQGFFELCGIAAINLGIITVANMTCKKHRKDSKLLKLFNISFAVITLVLIAAAFSKMALYIHAYGLTIPRLLPCVFMVFMAVVFIALIALQKWDFSIVRLALVSGSVMLCVLFLVNPDALVVRYNTDRYMSGTLSEYDPEILHRSGFAGVIPAIEVYESTPDEQLRQEISKYFYSLITSSQKRDTNEQSSESRQAISALKRSSD